MLRSAVAPFPSPHQSQTKKSAREAAALFVQDARFGWGRRELAAWLMCHYGRCVMERGLLEDHEVDQAECGPARSSVSDCTIVELVCEAHTMVVQLLSDLGDRSRAEGISRLMIAKGSVVAVRDSGGVSYAPADLKRMRLSERVASLFVADYLNAPFDYRDLRICRSCGSVVYAFSGPREGCTSCKRRDSHVSGCELESTPELVSA